MHHLAQQAPTSLSEAAKSLECGTGHILPSSAEDENTLYLLSSMHLYVVLLVGLERGPLSLVSLLRSIEELLD
jgi:hypothetical protein